MDVVLLDHRFEDTGRVGPGESEASESVPGPPRASRSTPRSRDGQVHLADVAGSPRREMKCATSGLAPSTAGRRNVNPDEKSSVMSSSSG